LKLLFDDNLSWRLVKLLSETFPSSKHIRSIPSLSIPAKDIEIWEYAFYHDYIVVTNDDDFFKLAMLRDKCPKIIILRTGNKRTNEISSILSNNYDKIKKFYEQQDYIIFEIR